MESRNGGHRQVVTLNIKTGLPLADDAINRMQSGVAIERANGTRVVRIIHGWGSSGRGGTIRERVHQELASMRARGTIIDYIPGEEFSISSEKGDRLLLACPELRTQMVQDRRNPGITFVLLR